MERNMDALLALEKRSPAPDGKYVVLVYFATSPEIVTKVDTYGAILVAGTYANKTLAILAANEIIEVTKYHGVSVIKAYQWEFLKSETNIDRTKVIPANKDLILKNQAAVNANLDIKTSKADYSYLEDAAEHQRKLRNPDTLENYNYNIYRLLELKERLTITNKRIADLEDTIEKQLTKHPEFLDSEEPDS